MENNIIYIRTSTIEQTPELQLRDIETLVKIEDCVIHKEQLSAWKDNVKRPEFDKILMKVKYGKIGNIYVWNLDRIFRNRTKLTGFLKLCFEKKIKVFSYTQKWLNDIYNIPYPFNEMVTDMMIFILGYVAEQESEFKSKRVKMAVVKKDNKTLSHKGNIWGRKSLSPQVVNKVIELKQQGFSIREIALQVIRYDKNNNGQNISKSSVHKILSEYSTVKT